MNKDESFDKWFEKEVKKVLKEMKNPSMSEINYFTQTAKSESMDVKCIPKFTKNKTLYVGTEQCKDRLKDKNFFPTLLEYDLYLCKSIISTKSNDDLMKELNIIDPMYLEVLTGNKSYVSYYLTHPDIMKKVRTRSLVKRLIKVYDSQCININKFCDIASSIEGKDISQCTTYNEKFIYSALTLIPHTSLEKDKLLFSIIDFLLENKVDALFIALSLLLDFYKSPHPFFEGKYNNYVDCRINLIFSEEKDNSLYSYLCYMVMQNSNDKYDNLKQVIELLYNIPGIQIYVLTTLLRSPHNYYGFSDLVYTFEDRLYNKLAKPFRKDMQTKYNTTRLKPSVIKRLKRESRASDEVIEILRLIF